MTALMERLTSKIPDFKELADIFNAMVEQHNQDTVHIEDNQKT